MNVKHRILRHLHTSVRPRDTYSDAEVKLRAVMNELVDEGRIAQFDVKSDPSGPEYVVWWTYPGQRGFEKIRVDPKRIDPDLLTVMEVLES